MLKRILLRLLVAIAVVGVVALGWTYAKLRQSLPALDGERALVGLAAPVEVRRDAEGVPEVVGQSFADVMRVLGFVHAQERFFQMDMQRRLAAGELSALVGEVTLGIDRENRRHRFRARAERVLERLRPEHRALLDAYVEGVNAGLAALGEVPFEYMLLRAKPAPWQASDSTLCVYAMYLRLQEGDAISEGYRGRLDRHLPRWLTRYLDPRGTSWDAPLDGGELASVPWPPPELVDLRVRPLVGIEEPSRMEPPGGSNNWAVSGAHTAHRGAMLANDMHLGLAVPNTWYRAVLIATAPHQRRVVGVTLPGVPAMVVGSNGDIAWGLTNSHADFADLVELEVTGGDPFVYQTPDGAERMQIINESIDVAGKPSVGVEVHETRWGPVQPSSGALQEPPVALRWVAYDPEAINFEMLDLMTAVSVSEAMAIAGRAAVPTQNFVVADRQGNIGWTLIGPIPKRFGHDGRLPTSWADGRRGWDGYLSLDARPRIVNPPAGRLWTANARVVGGEDFARLGDGGYDLGARAKQIRDRLLARETFAERDMLAIQLDDEAVFLTRWHDLLARVLGRLLTTTPDPEFTAAAQEVATWGGHAAVDSVGYVLVRDFRDRVHERALAPLGLGSPGETTRQLDDVVWQLVSQAPVHLLSPQYASWDELAAIAAREVVELCADSLDACRWGRRNTSEIVHPLSGSVPLLGLLVDMPRTPLPGDNNVPRVQGNSHGASERLVVSPGREEHGLFHMPSGQSGHPLSPYYGAGHAAWEQGEPTPLLPGSAVYRLMLVPGAVRL